jgi:hypothetical protein
MWTQQWLELSTWGDPLSCEVHVNGLPGCSWTGKLQVSEAGRSMAVRLIQQLSNEQISDLFTAARANLMRNDSIQDWIEGFKTKIQRDLVDVICSTAL